MFKDALNNKDYKAVLRAFNEKEIAKSIGKMLGVENNEYQQKVVNLLRGDCHDGIVTALVSYLPVEIPR